MTNARCNKCGKSLRSDNRSGYCRNHTPKGGMSYGSCSGCGARLGRDNHTGKCRRCFMRQVGKRTGGKIGTANHSWCGGVTYRDGYRFLKMAGHAMANARGYVAEHRLVVSQQLGRDLLSTESVHHINENRSDNRAENLMLFDSETAHQRYHATRAREGLVWDGSAVVRANCLVESEVAA